MSDKTYSDAAQRNSLQVVIGMLKRGQLGPKSELSYHADVLSQILNRVIDAERRRETKDRGNASSR